MCALRSEVAKRARNSIPDAHLPSPPPPASFSLTLLSSLFLSLTESLPLLSTPLNPSSPLPSLLIGRRRGRKAASGCAEPGEEEAASGDRRGGRRSAFGAGGGGVRPTAAAARSGERGCISADSPTPQPSNGSEVYSVVFPSGLRLIRRRTADFPLGRAIGAGAVGSQSRRENSLKLPRHLISAS